MATNTAEWTSIPVVGLLVLGNREVYKKKVLKELVDNGKLRIEMDCSLTSYIDSHGLGLLVSVSKKIKEKGGEFRIRGLGDDLLELFRLTKLDTLITLVDVDGVEIPPE
jgi:anti-sigma B factor antagonist